jgi:hypothetical protein
MSGRREAERGAPAAIADVHGRAARLAGETARYRSERANDRARILRVQNLLLAAAHRRLREKRLI